MEYRIIYKDQTVSDQNLEIYSLML